LSGAEAAYDLGHQADASAAYDLGHDERGGVGAADDSDDTETDV